MLASADTDDQQHESARELLLGADPVATIDLAYYEVINVAVRSWHDLSAARSLRLTIAEIEQDGGLIRVDEAIAQQTTEIAGRRGLSAYDAAYVAGSAAAGLELVSCDLADLVAPGLAVTPTQALQWST